MEKFLEFVVQQLVDQPEAASWREESHGEVRAYFVTLSASDLGKVIGKQGHTIRAIRNLLSAAAARQRLRVAFEIDEKASPDGPTAG